MGRRKILNFLLNPLGFQVYKHTNKKFYHDVFKITRDYKKGLVQQIGESLNYTIASGPFEGLLLPKYGAWSDLDIASKLIGAYEQEIFPAIEDIIHRYPKFIVNIGASEGYYAIGLKRRLPATLCYTYDIDERTFSILAECMESNRVEVSRLEIFDYQNPLIDIDETRHDFGCFIVDCEGFETEIIKFPRSTSQSSIFLIELHESIKPGVTKLLMDFFSETHDVEIFSQTDHSLGGYPQLQKYDLFQRSIILDELRDVPMQWLYALPLEASK